MTQEAPVQAEIKPFRIAVAPSDIDDLKRRLAATRWPDELPGYGFPLSQARELAEYWRSGYDWRKQEARLNEIPQYTTTIEGQNIHFVHIRSKRTDALPLLLVHGWPGSIVEFT
ncbi:MAG: epoxide hydrolase N-terminal domain-containing protein, partial [Streptosporangiaceae bacterium]